MGLLDPIMAIFGIDPGVLKARNLEWDGDLDGAIASIRDLIQKKGPTPKRLNFLAWFLTNKGALNEALRTIDQAIEAAPTNAEWQATRGRILRRLGRHAEALPLMKAQHAKNKMDIFNSSELCELLADMGKAGDAAPIFQSMQSMFGAEAGTAQARRIGMTQAYERARERLRQAGVV